MGRLCCLIFAIGYLALVYNNFVMPEDPKLSTTIEASTSMPKTIVLELPPSEDNPRNSEGDFIRLESGEILYVYTHYYGESDGDHSTAKLVSRISQDYGTTWSTEDELVLENEGQMNIMSVSLQRLKDRSIALFYLVKENAGDCRPYLRYSYDEGQTWTKRIETIPDPSYNVVNNSRVVLLPEGRLIIPVARHFFRGGDVYNYEAKATLFCLYSDDGGRHWHESEAVPNSNGIIYQEPGVVELGDGRLLMTIRCASGRQYYSYSEDRGETWSDSIPSPLISPMSPAAIKRELNSDRLVAVWNESTDRRDPLTIALLSPDGKTILKKKTLDKSLPDEVRGFCYPSLFFVDQDVMLVAYCAGRSAWGIQAIRMSRIDLRDLRK